MEGTTSVLGKAKLLAPHRRPHAIVVDLGSAAAHNTAGDTPTAQDSHIPRGCLGDACEARRRQGG
eukprot:1739454-Pyramimonas_sp.AAC.1